MIDLSRVLFSHYWHGVPWTHATVSIITVHISSFQQIINPFAQLGPLGYSRANDGATGNACTLCSWYSGAVSCSYTAVSCAMAFLGFFAFVCFLILSVIAQYRSIYNRVQFIRNSIDKSFAEKNVHSFSATFQWTHAKSIISTKPVLHQYFRMGVINAKIDFFFYKIMFYSILKWLCRIKMCLFKFNRNIIYISRNMVFKFLRYYKNT